MSVGVKRLDCVREKLWKIVTIFNIEVLLVRFVGDGASSCMHALLRIRIKGLHRVALRSIKTTKLRHSESRSADVAPSSHVKIFICHRLPTYPHIPYDRQARPI